MTEVLVASDAPKSVCFAASELTNFLARAFASEVPLRFGSEECEVANGEKTLIVLGDNRWSRAAGLDSTKLPRDGFEIVVTNGCVYIAGRDDPKVDFAALIRDGKLGGPQGNIRQGERGTLFGVYEFLERFAGCRFYFPGELGEVVPRRDVVDVPTGRLVRRPSFTVRDVYMQDDGPWPGEADEKASRRGIKSLNWLRLRMETESIPCCHGQIEFQLSNRFGATHPEWFHLAEDPSTHVRSRVTGLEPGNANRYLKEQFCHSNDELWDQIFADAKAYFDGEDPAKRGIRRAWNAFPSGWGPNFVGNYVDVMAQDGMRECLCEKCQKAYDKSAGPTGYASELMWRRTAELARRLADAGYPAIVTQMSYTPYAKMPSFELPSNVLVMVSRQGPWSVGNPSQFAKEKNDVRAWAEKLGHKVWLWTYPAKHPSFALGFKGPPDFAPRTWHRYYREMSPWILGAFSESECERAIYHYLNYYVYAKLAWDLDLDIDALLEEHYRLMYGAAAEPMQAAFEMFERKWTGEVAGNVVQTPIGPQPQAPCACELWTRIWNAAALDEVAGLFDRAAALAPAGSLEARRVAFMRENFLDPLLREAKARLAALSVANAQARRRANPPKNLLENGSFDPQGGGWKKPENGAGYDTTTFVSPPASFRVTSDDGKAWSCCMQSMKGVFKPKTTYRVSGFAKLDKVAITDPRKYHSYSCWNIAYYDKWYTGPRGAGYLRGSADWFYFETTFTTGERNPDDAIDPYEAWGFNGNMRGTAWVDDLVLEEISQPTKGQSR